MYLVWVRDLGGVPGHKEFLRLGPALGLWLLFALQLVLGPVWELVLELVQELVQELELVGELGLEVEQWL